MPAAGGPNEMMTSQYASDLKLDLGSFTLSFTNLCEHLFKNLGQVKVACVYHDGILGYYQRRIVAGHVALIAFVYLGKRFFVCAFAAFCPVFLKAPSGGFGFAVRKNLMSALGKQRCRCRGLPAHSLSCPVRLSNAEVRPFCF